jgi:hypothetical protein
MVGVLLLLLLLALSLGTNLLPRRHCIPLVIYTHISASAFVSLYLYLSLKPKRFFPFLFF